MAELSKEQLSEVVSRVTSIVSKEMQVGESTFSVPDLRSQVGELGKMGAVAWEISYKTSSAALGRGDLVRPGSAVAWEISYKTSSASLGGMERA